MSSLPPYNRVDAELNVWMISSDSEPGTLGPVLGAISGIGQILHDGSNPGLLEMLRAAYPGVAVDAVGPPDGAAARLAKAPGDAVLLARPGLLAAAVLALLGAPGTGARLEILPGLLTQVQLLTDRVVVRHLNQGGALL